MVEDLSRIYINKGCLNIFQSFELVLNKSLNDLIFNG